MRKVAASLPWTSNCSLTLCLSLFDVRDGPDSDLGVLAPPPHLSCQACPTRFVEGSDEVFLGGTVVTVAECQHTEERLPIVHKPSSSASRVPGSVGRVIATESWSRELVLNRAGGSWRDASWLYQLW